jgi:hypothetical protein
MRRPVAPALLAWLALSCHGPPSNETAAPSPAPTPSAPWAQDADVIYGAGMLRDEGARFPLPMLSEGGYDELADASFATRFRKIGGQRVLLGCSTGGCAPKMEPARRLLEKAGVPARLNDAGHLGNDLDSRVVTSLQRDWPWLGEGAPGW